jgi:hypothetical protein
MFVIPCKYNTLSSLFETINSISKFHPNEKILVVDSDSDDKSYFDLLKQINNVIICDIQNKNYEIGALWYAYKNFNDESHYILIHDSFVLKESLSNFIVKDATYAMMYFDEDMYTHGNSHSDLRESEINYAKEVLLKTEYCFNRSVNGALGTMGIYSHNVLENFNKKGLMNSLIPIDKFGSNMSERIIGICCKQEGFDFKDNNVEGNYLQKLHEISNDKLTFFTKKFPRRN